MEISFSLIGVKAKTDTGTDLSSIWCGEIKKIRDKLECVFFGTGEKRYKVKMIEYVEENARKRKSKDKIGA